MRFKLKKENGFTLIEILVVIAILVLVSGLVFASFSRFRSQQALQASTEEVLSALNYARSRTLAAHEGSNWGVHLASTSVFIFKGSFYDSGAATNQEVILTGGIIASSTLTGGAVDLVFDRLTGKTAQVGTITIRSTTESDLSRTITVRSSGTIGAN